MNQDAPGRCTALSGLSFVCLVAALTLGGGLLVQLADPTSSGPPEELALQAAVAAGCLVAALLVGAACARRLRRRFAFWGVLWTLLAATTLLLGEILAGCFVPPWPAKGLHGVPPSDPGAWATRAGARPGSVGVNSWGQRDTERSVAPPPGLRRIVFIGDSFLEESSTRPLTLVLEERLGKERVEVVNLGVSATDPDEYYWRLRTIALALRPTEIVVLLYAGNDFISAPSLPDGWGLAAPYPKRSVLSVLGLTNLNHLVANGDRPLLRVWSGAGDLQATEERLHARIRGAGDREIERLLSTLAPPPYRERLFAHLKSRDLSGFYAGLREPDAGLFRSYYLVAALQSSDPFVETPAPVDERSVGYVLSLIEQMGALCRDRGIAFRVAIAPEASQVDPRFQQFWGSMSRLTEQKAWTGRTAARLAAEARARGVQVIDLTAGLQGVAGAYYNLDGHWSEVGVEAAARQLARDLAEEAAKP